MKLINQKRSLVYPLQKQKQKKWHYDRIKVETGVEKDTEVG